MSKIKQCLYYYLIGLISLVSLVFLPMLGSDIGLDWNVPNTAVGWIVWLMNRLIIAVINVLMFYSFMQQAKLNIKDNPKYIEARTILEQQNARTVLPRSPQKWSQRQWMTKGASLFISSALATVALTQAILTFDWVSMLTYFFVILMGLVFGVLQMKSAEEYWTEEYYQYALMLRENNIKGDN